MRRRLLRPSCKTGVRSNPFARSAPSEARPPVLPEGCQRAFYVTMDSDTKKTCTKCGEEKPLGDFSKAKNGKHGRQASCRDCQKAYYRENRDRIQAQHKIYAEKNKEALVLKAKEYYEKNKEEISRRQKAYYKRTQPERQKKIREYTEKNKEATAAYKKRYYEENKEKIRAYKKEYQARNSKRLSAISREHYKKNKDARKKLRKDYYEKNKDEIIKKSVAYIRKRYAKDPAYRLNRNLRSRLYNAIRSQHAKRTRRTFELVGCSEEFLRAHLEAQFDDNMTWDNYGPYWHVDHILPCSSFDHNDPEQVAACWNWSNLRPLEGGQNIRKSNKTPTNEELERARRAAEKARKALTV